MDPSRNSPSAAMSSGDPIGSAGVGSRGGSEPSRDMKHFLLRKLLARSLRLLRLHVRCTCEYKGKHTRICHQRVAASIAAEAERLGVDAHYGLKEKENRMVLQQRVAKRVLGAFLIAFLLLATRPTGSTAQEPDTLTIEVLGYGLVAGVGHNCPIDNNGKVASYVGAEIQCPVWVVDADGDETPGHIIVEVADSAFVQAFVTGDSLLTVRVLRKGNTHIKLYPEPILLVAFVYPDNILYGGAEPWDTIQPLWATVTRDSITGQPIAHVRTKACAYLGKSFGEAVAKGRAELQEWPCPDIGGVPLPEFPVSWAPVYATTDENGEAILPLPRPIIAMPLEPLSTLRE